MPKPGTWPPTTGDALVGDSLRILSQNIDTGEERTITEGELYSYFSGKTVDGGKTLTATQIKDALTQLAGNDRLDASAVKGVVRLALVSTLAGLPAEGQPSTLYAVDNDNGKRSLLLYVNGFYEDYTPGGFAPATGSGGTRAYFLTDGGEATEIMYEGPGPENAVTASSSEAGVILINIPQSAEGMATFRIPSEYCGRDTGSALTVHFQYRSDYPFNQREVSLKHPTSIEVYDRAAESASGADVLRGGNNPQRRVLPFATAGRMSVQIAGSPENYLIAISL